MAYIDISSKTALIMLNTDGTDDPDQLVAVAAGELFEWARLIGKLAGWLEGADEHTRAPGILGRSVSVLCPIAPRSAGLPRPHELRR